MKKTKEVPIDFFKSVGANIKRIRERNGYTLLYISENARISIGNLADIENGQNTNPTLYTLKKVADALEVPISTFFRGL
jgi:transcriptional regulator with XRE-family HTH domain